MSWIKLCDRTHQRKRAARAGVTGMGWWGALMTHAAHIESDGHLDAEDIEHAWHFGFDKDIELWSHLLEEAAEELDGVSEAEKKAFAALLRRASRRLSRSPERVRDVLVDQLCDAKLLRRPRGRGRRYTLEHPDREPYLTHQLSREQNTLARQRARERQQRHRERLRAEQMVLEEGITIDQALEMLQAEPTSRGDSHRTSHPQPSPAPPHDEARPAPNSPPSADFENEPSNASSLDFVTPSRPPRDEEDKFELLPLEVREIHSALLAEAPLKPFAENFNLSLSLYRLQKHLKASTAAIVAAIHDTAVEAVVRRATGTIRNFHAWMTETLISRCRASSDSRVSEREHKRLTAHEKRTPETQRRLAYERQFETDRTYEERRTTLREQLHSFDGANGVLAVLRGT
ncbi:MAG: hypothetical protein R3B72_49430 [Polyangiaceae bacterium]